MSLDKAVKHGKERRLSWRDRGRPGEIDKSCRPHGGGRARPCPYCERARRIAHHRAEADSKDKMENP